MKKCVFLDRDGVINVERGEYTFKTNDFIIEEGVLEQLLLLKQKGFIFIIITNQGGINKGLYTVEDVFACHKYFQKESNSLIDDFFYSPYHDKYTKSLSRKPNSLMLERAIYKWNVDIELSWMVGDSNRDIDSAINVGLKSIKVGNSIYAKAEQSFESPAQALKFINKL